MIPITGGGYFTGGTYGFAKNKSYITRPVITPATNTSMIIIASKCLCGILLGLSNMDTSLSITARE